MRRWDARGLFEEGRVSVVGNAESKKLQCGSCTHCPRPTRHCAKPLQLRRKVQCISLSRIEQRFYSEVIATKDHLSTFNVDVGECKHADNFPKECRAST